ncbi:MAG: anthranilate synthase component I [Myxococcales bacterium]|nr:anthranilate synthase component I [Myxococcales bacterium]
MPPYQPTEAVMARLAEAATVVPVHREILADGLTPVVAKATVGQGPGSFLLESVVGGEKWARYSFVGLDPALRVRGVADRFETNAGDGWRAENAVDPWVRLRETLGEWRAPHVPWLPRFWGGAVGYVSYDAVRRFEPTVAPAIDGKGGEFEFSFALANTLVVFDNLRQTLRVIVPAFLPKGADTRAAYDDALKRLDAVEAKLRAPRSLSPLPMPDASSVGELPPSSMDKATYCEAVERAKEHIRAGDIFQLVLSQRFRVPLGKTDPFDVYRALRVINPSPYMYFLRLDEAVIAGASPETLVRIEDGTAQVRPIAGTRPRGATEEADRALEVELLADPKEVAEHVMLVDLGRNDLGRIATAGSVRVTDRMVIERYSHVMHIVSNVVAELAPGRDALDVLRATFPAGTLSGAPKVRAMQIIEELEPERRGLYGGAVGYIGFDGNMDVAIAIRTAVIRDGEIHLQAGAGIVEASDGNAEYDETVNKARAGLIAIRAAQKV